MALTIIWHLESYILTTMKSEENFLLFSMEDMSEIFYDDVSNSTLSICHEVMGPDAMILVF